MGAEIEEGQDHLVIDGDNSELKGANVNGRHDHRIVMSLAIAGLVAEGETTIQTSECVEISYPNFFNELSNLGAQTTTINKNNNTR